MIESFGSAKSWLFVSRVCACAIGAAALFSACGSGGDDSGAGGDNSTIQ